MEFWRWVGGWVREREGRGREGKCAGREKERQALDVTDRGEPRAKRRQQSKKKKQFVRSVPPDNRATP
jgi:hypothetical protein